MRLRRRARQGRALLPVLLLSLVTACHLVYPIGAASEDAAPPATDGPAHEGSCPPLADNFDDGQTGPQWSPWAIGGASPPKEQGGRLVIEILQNVKQAAYAGYCSMCRHDLTGRRVSVEVPAAASSATSADVSMYLGAADGRRYGMIKERGQLHLGACTGSGCPLGQGWSFAKERPYSSTDDRFWGASQTGGTLWLETSKDGKAWTRACSYSVGAALLSVCLEAGAYETSTVDPGSAEFDNLKLDPI